MLDSVDVEMLVAEELVGVLADDVHSVLPVEPDSGVLLVVDSLLSLVVPLNQHMQIRPLYTAPHDNNTHTQTQKHTDRRKQTPRNTHEHKYISSKTTTCPFLDYLCLQL